ncbi:MAG: alpha/beta hydrolase [Acidobacteriota bacterium]
MAESDPSPQERSPVRFAIGLVVLMAVATAAAGAFFVANPVGIGLWIARSGLERAGLERQTAESAAGPQTFFVGGQGPETLVLLHGLGNQAGTWLKVVADLQVRRRVVAVDLAGHGDSAPASGPITMDQSLEGLDGVLGAISPDRPVTLMANSFGGWVALRYAEAHPDRVSGLLLINGGGLRADLGELTLLPQDRDQMRRLVRAMGPAWAREPAGFVLDDLMERIHAGPTPRQIDGLRNDDAVDDRLGAIDVPAQVLWGVDDGLTPLEQGRRLADGLPNADFHTLEGCGHLPQQQCPRLLLQVLWPLL